VSFGSFKAGGAPGWRLVVRMTNTGPDAVEVQSGWPLDAPDSQTRVTLTYAGGRAPRTEVAALSAAQLDAGEEGYLAAEGLMDAAEFAALQGVEVVALVRAPEYQRESWEVTTDDFSSSGDTASISGSISNMAGSVVLAPLIGAYLLDADRNPLTFFSRILQAQSIGVGQSVDWSFDEELPPGLAEAADKVAVYADTSADRWGVSGDRARQEIAAPKP